MKTSPRGTVELVPDHCQRSFGKRKDSAGFISRQSTQQQKAVGTKNAVPTAQITTQLQQPLQRRLKPCSTQLFRPRHLQDGRPNYFPVRSGEALFNYESTFDCVEINQRISECRDDDGKLGGRFCYWWLKFGSALAAELSLLIIFTAAVCARFHFARKPQ